MSAPRPLSRAPARDRLLRALAAALTGAALAAATAGPAAAGNGYRADPNVWEEADPLAYPSDWTADYFLRGDVPGGAPPYGVGGAVGPERSARTTVGPWPTAVHVDVPAGSAVALEVTRLQGSFPALLWVQDAAGRVWTPAVRRVGRTLVAEEVVAVSDGGLDFVLSPTRTPAVRVEVAARVRDGGPGTGAGSSRLPWAPDRIVAEFDDPDAALVWAAETGVTVVDSGVNWLAFAPPDGRTGREGADARFLTEWCGGGIGFEPDGYARTPERPEGSGTNMAVVGSEFGRHYDRQVALRQVFAPPPGRGIDGAGTLIAVVDTGVDATHPRLAGRVVPGYDFVANDADASEERDGVDQDEDGDADDGYGHGTVVAGIALAVAPGAKILPVRVLDDEGVGTVTQVAKGIRYAALRGANVVNLSLGTRSFSPHLRRAVQEVVAQGVLVVVAAGNDGDRWSVDFPADVPGVVAVTATGVQGRRPPWANGNRTTTVSAPGVRVLGPYPGGLWALGTGTSFATPVASGAAALLVQRSGPIDAHAFRDVLAPRVRVDLRPLWR